MAKVISAVMRSNKHRINSLIKSIDRGSLKLEEGTKQWRCYRLDIQHLLWERNMMDGWQIDVYIQNKRGFSDHIGSIQIDGNLNKVTTEIN